jgi:hypothetical protein
MQYVNKLQREIDCLKIERTLANHAHNEITTQLRADKARLVTFVKMVSDVMLAVEPDSIVGKAAVKLVDEMEESK